MTTATAPERRRFIRHPSTIPLRCRKTGHSIDTEGLLHDIDEGGLRFVAPEGFVRGDLLEIEFPSLRGDGSLRGEVMWACTHRDAVAGEGEGGYETGMRFLSHRSMQKARVIEQICHIEAYRQEQRRDHGRELTANEAAREWIERYARDFPRLTDGDPGDDLAAPCAPDPKTR